MDYKYIYMLHFLLVKATTYVVGYYDFLHKNIVRYTVISEQFALHVFENIIFSLKEKKKKTCEKEKIHKLKIWKILLNKN